MILNKIIKKIKNILDKFIGYLENNFSEKVVDILELVLFVAAVVVVFYLFFIAFTEILLLLILFMLIMIYRKL